MGPSHLYRLLSEGQIFVIQFNLRLEPLRLHFIENVSIRTD